MMLSRQQVRADTLSNPPSAEGLAGGKCRGPHGFPVASDASGGGRRRGCGAASRSRRATNGLRGRGIRRGRAAGARLQSRRAAEAGRVAGTGRMRRPSRQCGGPVGSLARHDDAAGGGVLPGNGAADRPQAGCSSAKFGGFSIQRGLTGRGKAGWRTRAAPSCNCSVRIVTGVSPDRIAKVAPSPAVKFVASPLDESCQLSLVPSARTTNPWLAAVPARQAATLSVTSNQVC